MSIFYILIALFIFATSDYSVFCQTKDSDILAHNKKTSGSGVYPKQSTNITDSAYPDSSTILPVELDFFSAKFTGTDVYLNWQTSAEINNYGFTIERQVFQDTALSKYDSINYWSDIGFVKGSGNSNSKKSYTFIDHDPSGGYLFYYRLKEIDSRGNYFYSNVTKINIAPSGFSLSRNYPNPFNPSTSIDYTLPQESKVSIKLYDILGRKVATLVNKTQNAGKYSIKFNAGYYTNISSGIYIYRMQAGSFAATQKLILLK